MKTLRSGWKVGLLTAVAFGDLGNANADFFAVNLDLVSRSIVRICLLYRARHPKLANNK